MQERKVISDRECFLLVIVGRVRNIESTLSLRTGRAEASHAEDQTGHAFESHVETGFQIATFQGPLCAEPVEGVAYFLEALEVDSAGIEEERRKCSPTRCNEIRGTDKILRQCTTGWRRLRDR